MSFPPHPKSKLPGLSSPISLPPLPGPVSNRYVTMHSRASSLDPRSYDEHVRSSIPNIFSASRAFQSVLGVDKRAPTPFLQPPVLPWSVERLMEQWRVTERQNSEYGKTIGPGLLTKDRVRCESVRDSEEIGYRVVDHHRRNVEGLESDDTSKREERTTKLQALASQRLEAEDDSETETEIEFEDEDTDDEDSNSDAGANPQQLQEKAEDDEEIITFSTSQLNPGISFSLRHKSHSTPNLTNVSDSFVTVPTILVSSPTKERQIQDRNPDQPPLKRPRTSSLSSPSQNLPKPPAAKKRRSLPWSTSFNVRTGPLSFSQNLTQTLLSWFRFATQAQMQGRLAKCLEEDVEVPYWAQSPKEIPLICASFWTLETDPPRELLRIEPGDVQLMRWCEVDTFLDRKAEKGVLGKLLDSTSSERQRACREGRWSFLIVREHCAASPSSSSADDMASFEEGAGNARGEGIRPYHTLAFPTSSITSSSTDVIYVTSQETSAAKPDFLHPNYSPSTTASIQLQQTPLRRTILYLEKAGNLPLIESRDTDTGIWSEWIEAVGKGYGRIMVWSKAGDEIVGGKKEANVPPQWLETLVEKHEERY